MGTTESLAQWIVATSYADIPAAAYEQAKKSILDFLGTAIQGSTTELGRMIADFTEEQGGTPQARVIATKIRTAAANAAFANGALGHAEDFDDLGGIGGHPAIVLTPPALALAEELHLSGREVLTVEGIDIDGKLHPLQEAFADLGAAQCGYCTPGILLTAKALLERHPNPTRDQIKEALSGNICRCTGYLQIFDAVEAAILAIGKADPVSTDVDAAAPGAPNGERDR